MARTYVVDASVVAKWFNSGEEYEDEATLLKKAWIDERVRLIAPFLLSFEVANSIWKNTNVRLQDAVSLVRLAFKLSPELVELEGEVVEDAMSLARKKGLPFYDASYIALAKFLSHPLITADREQMGAAERSARAMHLKSFSKVDV